MKQRIILLVAAMCLLPNLHFAATTTFDSERPTAISGDTVMSDIPDSIAPYELIEGLSASDMANVPNYEMFMSSLYLGWGGAHFDAASRPAFKSTVFEAGILNFAAFGYVFNHKRSRVSLGVGFDWSRYRLHRPYFFDSDDAGTVGIVSNDGDYHDHHASLSMWAVQFPLMYSHRVAKHCNVAAAAVLRWNCYADFHNGYSMGNSDYSVTTHGLRQRPLSLDWVGMVSTRFAGVYVRYSPQSLLRSGAGPDISNRWTVGLVIGGL